jgi:hypothetical protein
MYDIVICRVMAGLTWLLKPIYHYSLLLFHPIDYLMSLPPVAACDNILTWEHKVRSHLWDSYINYFPSPCFAPLCFKAACQFTPLLNLCFVIFGLMPFDWLHWVTLTLSFCWEYRFFIHAFLIYAHFLTNTSRTWNKSSVSSVVHIVKRK